MIKNYNYIGDLQKHEHNHHFLGEPLLVPNVNKTDSNRLTMFCSQLSQSVPNTQGEAPLVLTNFENQVGEYTIDGFLRADSDKEILAKIQRNKLNYTLIVRDKDGVLSHIERSEGCWLTEHYGFRYNNTNIDNKKPGDIIKEDEMLYRANSYDDEGNLKYGRNMNLCFTVFKNLTLEDPMVISRSAAEKMSYDSVNKVSISLNHNDLLINLYGDEEDYKAFPNIGEEVREDTILCSRRRIDYNKLLPKLKDNRLRDIDLDDTIFYCSGKIIDIEIYTNQNEDELAKQEYNNQIYNLYMEDKAYKKKLVECIETYMESDGSNMTPELVLLYNRSKLILENDNKKDRNIWVDDSNGSDFKGTKLIFTIMEHHPLTVGSKLSGRYGNKGVLSAILPDEMMPEIEEGPFKGQRIEVMANALGIFNRLIPLSLAEVKLYELLEHPIWTISSQTQR